MRKLAFLILLAVSACTKDTTPPSSEESTTTNTTTGNSTTTGTTTTGSSSTGTTTSTGSSTTGTTTGTTTTTASTSFFPKETGVFQTDMLAYVNALRTKGCKCNGVQMPIVPALKWNKLLENAALKHGNDMYTKNFFSHTGSDGSSMSQRITSAGYKWSYASENIAWGYTTLPSVINGWIASAGHCKNMMSASITEIGAAKVGTYWVQDFGKPF
jgi:uncharacterized protein YkwD